MSSRPRKILILGCGGFIGSHLLERLLGRSKDLVTGVDLRPEKIGRLLKHPRFSFIQGDIYQDPRVLNEIAKCDPVIQLAALCNPSLYNTEPVSVIESNYDKPLGIVKACASMKKWLIHFSTSEVYGKTPGALVSDPWPIPYVMSEENAHMVLGPVQKQRWTYACAKQLLERVIYAYGREKGLSYTIVRPFNFIGPRMDYIPGLDGDGVPRVVPLFMQALFSGTPLNLVDGGASKRVFTDIDDAMDALELIVQNPEKSQGRIFNIGNPANEISIKALAGLMKKLYPGISGNKTAAACELKSVTSEEFYGPGYDDCDRRVPDISLAGKILGWAPKIELAAALKKTMAGFVEHYWRKKPVHA